MPESSAMDGDWPLAQALDASAARSRLAIPFDKLRTGLDAGFRHPCPLPE
jgi:hypothetical protein